MRDHVAAQEDCTERYVGARIPLEGFRADYLKTTLQIESYYFLGLYFLWKLYGQCRAQVFAIFTAASEFSGVQDVDIDEVAFRDIQGIPSRIVHQSDAACQKNHHKSSGNGTICLDVKCVTLKKVTYVYIPTCDHPRIPFLQMLQTNFDMFIIRCH
jgi:hypothetical protein